MKDKIHSKLIEYGTAIGEESRIELVNELFDLFGVSHRREQFTDLLIWYKYNVGKDNLKNCEELAEEYINL